LERVCPDLPQTELRRPSLLNPCCLIFQLSK
jgi:hypothetical protein